MYLANIYKPAMKKYILVFLFVISNLVSYTQVLRGTVYDDKTKSTIPFASVYFNGTYSGTTSNKEGYFELDRSNYPSMPVTISAIGYYSITLSNVLNQELRQIYLKPKEYELKGTLVKSKSLVSKRKRYLALFKDEFLGITNNARECSILNEKDITFNYDSNIDTLKAFALKPIIIENRSLGYTITYYLDKFEYYRMKEAVFFSGSIFFREHKSTVEMQKQFLEKRKNAYLGSKMHFFRTLLNKNLKAQGFTILDPDYKNLKVEDIVVRDSANNNYLYYPSRFNIWNKNRPTNIRFLKKYVYFDKTGYFDPSGILWNGYMGEERIADWLPYEYSTEQQTFR